MSIKKEVLTFDNFFSTFQLYHLKIKAQRDIVEKNIGSERLNFLLKFNRDFVFLSEKYGYLSGRAENNKLFYSLVIEPDEWHSPDLTSLLNILFDHNKRITSC